MIKYIETYPYLSLLLCVFIMLGFSIDAIPVSIMEARNFISAREMLTDGSWLLTTMNGEFRFEKPPLPTWITALFGAAFGMTNVLALRWPTLLMIVLLGIYVVKFSRLLTKNNTFSVRNGFIVVTCFYVIGIVVEAVWDIYAHGFMIVALYYFFKLVKTQYINFKHGLFFVLFLAFSILSKGPVSLYALLLPFLLSYGLAYGYKLRRITYFKLAVLFLLGLLVGSSWYLYIQLSDPKLFTDMVSVETTSWSNRNVRPFYYYWSFFTQSGLWTIPAFISLLYPYLKHRVKDKSAYKFTFYWTIFSVILLSLIPEKKSRYLMPVLIPLAMNTGFYVEYLISKFKTFKTNKEIIPVHFNFGLIGFIAICTAAIGLLINDYFDHIPVIRVILLSIGSFCSGILIINGLIHKHMRQTFYSCIGFMMVLGLLGLPLVKKIKKPKNYNSIVNLSSQPEPLYTLNYISPEMVYYYGNKVPRLDSEVAKIAKDSIIYVTCNKCDRSFFDEFNSDFIIEFEENLDLNLVPKTSKSHNERNENMLARFTRK